MLDFPKTGDERAGWRVQIELLDQLQEAVIAVDSSFRVQYCNEAAERLFGWNAEEAIGQPYGIAAGTAVTEEQRAAIHSQILQQKSWNGEIICTHRDGTRFVAQVSWSVLRPGAGLEIVGIHRDVTAPKQMEQRLITERMETEAALRSSE